MFSIAKVKPETPTSRKNRTETTKQQKLRQEKEVPIRGPKKK